MASGTPLELERQIKNTTLELTVKSRSPEESMSMLGALPGIKSVERFRSDQPGLLSLRLETEHDTDPGRLFFTPAPGPTARF
jgi:hypothetical protein